MFNSVGYNLAIDSACRLQDYLDCHYEIRGHEVEVNLTQDTSTINVDGIEIWSDDIHGMDALDLPSMVELFEEAALVESYDDCNDSDDFDDWGM